MREGKRRRVGVGTAEVWLELSSDSIESFQIINTSELLIYPLEPGCTKSLSEASPLGEDWSPRCPSTGQEALGKHHRVGTAIVSSP